MSSRIDHNREAGCGRESSADPEFLLVLAKAGDGPALGRLLERYHNYMNLLVRIQVGRRLRAKVDSEDLLQEIWLEIHRKINLFRGASEREFLQWSRRVIGSILANQVRRYLGTKRRDLRLERAFRRAGRLVTRARLGLDRTPEHAQPAGGPARAGGAFGGRARGASRRLPRSDHPPADRRDELPRPGPPDGQNRAQRQECLAAGLGPPSPHTRGPPMNRETSTLSVTDNSRVIAALEIYLESLRAGVPWSREEFLARYADVGPELADCLSGIELVQAVAADLAGSGDSSEGSDALPPLAQLGDYRIVREIGRGGMGVVYEACQVSLGRRVALKVLPIAAAIDPRQRQRFQIEAHAAAQLHHPHIVPIFGVGYDHGTHYYAMQFVEGRSLAAWLRELRSSANGAPLDAESLAGPAVITTEKAPDSTASGDSGRDRKRLRAPVDRGGPRRNRRSHRLGPAGRRRREPHPCAERPVARTDVGRAAASRPWLLPNRRPDRRRRRRRARTRARPGHPSSRHQASQPPH